MNLQTNKPAPATVLRHKDGMLRPSDDGADEAMAPSVRLWPSILAGCVQLFLVLALIAAAFMAWTWFLATSPTAERKARERVARLVEVVPAAQAEQGPVIRAWGGVQAAQTLIVRPEIAGVLEWVHPDVAAGGLLTAGAEVARMGSRDLELALLRAESDIADIEARVLLEEGQAAIGERELTRLSRNITDSQRSLVLREPQMAQLRAELAAANAALEQARNALSRASVKVPFDALVISENVSPGTMLSAGMEAATLAAADQFNVILQVPARYLDWIALDGSQEVRLTQPGVWPEGAARFGHVARIGAGLSETGRMVELIVAVQDPLARTPENRGAPRLLLGSFLQGEIIGAPVASDISGALEASPVVRLDRALLRDDDTAWVMNTEDQLEIRNLQIAWRGPDAVLVTSGLAPGDRVVSTPLATFAPGMALRTRTAP